MRASASVNENGITEVSIVSASSQDVAALTNVFKRTGIYKHIGLYVNSSTVGGHDAQVSSVTFKNDPWITNKYLSTIGFDKVVDTDYIQGFFSQDYEYKKCGVSLIRHKGSNMVKVYINGEFADNRLYDSNDKFKCVGTARKISKLENILKSIIKRNVV